jgi:hypothetical protein
MRWMWTKAKVKQAGSNSELMLDKQRSLGNIEGLIALCAALNRAIVSEEEDGEWAAS